MPYILRLFPVHISQITIACGTRTSDSRNICYQNRSKVWERKIYNNDLNNDDDDDHEEDGNDDDNDDDDDDNDDDNDDDDDNNDGGGVGDETW